MPAAIEIGAPLAVKTGASPAVKADLPEQMAGRYAAPRVIPIAAAPAVKTDESPAVKNEEGEGTAIDRAEIAPGNVLNDAFAPIISCLRLASSHHATSLPAAPRPQVSRIVISGFAFAIGVLSLVAGFVVAFHRTEPVPGPQADSSPLQLSAPDGPSKPKPSPAAKNPAAVPEANPQPEAGPDASVEPAPAKVVSPITTTHRMMTPDRASRGPTVRVASRPTRGSHVPAFSRVPAPISTRRTTSAPGPSGAMERSAQRYFHLADQQLHKGNYSAAAAEYKRAWRIEENHAAAKGRLARARQAMQAKNESIGQPH